MQYSSWSNLKVRSFHDSKRLIQSPVDLANAKRRSSKEDLRGKEREGIRVSLFTFDEIILRGLTAVKVRPFSGSVNRKKIVDSGLREAGPSLATLGWAEPKQETYLENYIRKRFSSSLLSHRLIYALPESPMFLFRSFFFSFFISLSARFWGEMEFGSGPYPLWD